jgi:hypothetical protein
MLWYEHQMQTKRLLHSGGTRVVNHDVALHATPSVVRAHTEAWNTANASYQQHVTSTESFTGSVPKSMVGGKAYWYSHTRPPPSRLLPACHVSTTKFRQPYPIKPKHVLKAVPPLDGTVTLGQPVRAYDASISPWNTPPYGVARVLKQALGQQYVSTLDSRLSTFNLQQSTLAGRVRCRATAFIELIAMAQHYGIPSFFATFTAAEGLWSDMHHTYGDSHWTEREHHI